MKKSVNKLTAVIAVTLAVAVASCGTGLLAYAAGTRADTTPAVTGDQGGTASSVASAIKDAVDEKNSKNSKDETVYVLTDADGKVQKLIVSDWLRNPEGAASLNDVSDLQEIENVESDAAYTIGSNNALVWDAQGNDIQYRGTTDKELPVTVTVSYQLDGKTVTAAELAGATGHVTIRFDYQNNQCETVKIDGKDAKIYVPFVMLTGMSLDHSRCANITVSNGKLLNDGDRTLVMGFAVPGMNESLALDRDTLELPEDVEISFDATDFALDTTMTLASNELFNEVDLSQIDGLNELDDLSASMQKLDDAMTALLDGSSQLYTGLSTLLDKSGQLRDGVDQLAAALPQIRKLSVGATELNAGLKTLSGNSDSLRAGAKQTFTSLLAVADTQIAAAGVKADKLTIDNYDAVLSKLGASMSESDIRTAATAQARTKVEAAVAAQKDAVTAKVTEAVRAQVTAQVLAAAGVKNQDGTAMTAAQYQQAVAAGAIPAETQQQLAAAVEQQMQSAQVQALISQNTAQQVSALVEQQMQSADVQAQIEAGVKSALAGVSSLTALKTSLDSYNQFYQGVLTYTGGVDQAAQGSAQLSAGMSQLYTQLSAGITALQAGTDALVDGVTQLRDGSLQLSDGLKQLDEQGIQKLEDAFDGNLSQLAARLQALGDVSRGYTTFTGVSADMSGSVKFIYRTDSIGD